MSDDEYASPETPSHALTSTREHGISQHHHHDVSSTGKRVPSHRKGPRFSWTPAYEATFFRSLCESVQLNLKDNHSFKQEAWDRAIATLIERHGAYPNKGHLINKSDNARKKFRLWRGLRENPEFLYNPATRNVSGSDEAWRAHIEKEPLARSLRGRPFEHEEYMEILFPDVIGSGGAPKRITKPKRKENSAVPRTDDAGQAIMELLAADGNSIYHHHAQPQIQPQQAVQKQPPPPIATLHSSDVVPIPVHPTCTNIPPRTSIASTSALTPPDEETPHSRKRLLHQQWNSTGAPTTSTTTTTTTTSNNNNNNNNYHPSSGPAEKRRRTTHTNYIDLTHPSQLANPDNPLHAANNVSRHIVQDSILSLADALKMHQRPPPRWPEQALEIFFRDFGGEDADLQLKIAEKALTDANKAMMFCLMPAKLREHWIARLREAHNRTV